MDDTIIELQTSDSANVDVLSRNDDRIVTVPSPSTVTDDRSSGSNAFDYLNLRSVQVMDYIHIKKDRAEYTQLYRAIMNGDVETAIEIFREDKESLFVKLNDNGSSALHIAIGRCKDLTSVKQMLVTIGVDRILTLVTNNKLNALHYAAMVGNTRAVDMLVGFNPNLLYRVDGENQFPIHKALLTPHKDTFRSPSSDDDDLLVPFML